MLCMKQKTGYVQKRCRSSIGYHVAIGSKVRGFKPGRGLWILRTIMICSTTLFEVEIKPSATRRKILRHVKETCGLLQRHFACKINGHFSPIYSCFATRRLCYYVSGSCLVDKSEMIRTEMGANNRVNCRRSCDALYHTTL
jgi:hypothetical protein